MTPSALSMPAAGPDDQKCWTFQVASKRGRQITAYFNRSHGDGFQNLHSPDFRHQCHGRGHVLFGVDLRRFHLRVSENGFRHVQAVAAQFGCPVVA